MRNQRRLALALLADRGALTHAEPVLLVHHGHRKTSERHASLQQRVRADHQMRGAARESSHAGRPIGLVRRARQQPQGDLASLQHARQHAMMLLRQDLGGSHQRGLMPVRHREQHGVRGDGGLAASDVALEQSVHRVRLAKIGGDLGDHAVLLARESKGNAGADVRVDGGVDRQRHGARATAQLRPSHHHAKLQQQQLIERQTAPRTRERLRIGGPMHGAPRRGQRHQVALAPIGLGQRVLHAGAHRIKHARDHRLDLGRTDLLAGRIDRPEIVGSRHGVPGARLLRPAGVADLEIALAHARAAFRDAAFAGMDLAAHPGGVEPDQPRRRGPVVERGLDQGARTGSRAHARDLTAQANVRGLLAQGRDRLGDGSFRKSALVPHRKVAHQIPGGADPEVTESFGRARPDAGHGGQRGARIDGSCLHARDRTMRAWHESPSIQRWPRVVSSTRPRRPPRRGRMPCRSRWR